MDEKYREFSFPADSDFRDIRQGMTATRMAEFMAVYKPVWDFWQKWYHAFGQPQPIYPEQAPDYKPEYQQPVPSVAVKFHTGAPRGMVLVCAGGGFLWKAEYEGPAVAEALFNAGYNVAVLDYRVAPYNTEVSLEDGRRALRFLRYHAAEYNTRADKIAIMGFSAGGMIANICAALYDNGDPAAADPVERVSCRPDAALPCYGTFNRSAFTGGGLAYNREVQKTAAATDPSLIVHAGCPPYFIWQCAGQDDPRGALSLADRLAALGIPFELHIFPYGNHGLGLADAFGPNPTGNPHVALWVDCCVHWLREEGFGA
ncbi:MAG: alpha/beta hydrolase [Christensenellales bacterium]|jgi:acetyl esterase/lipase